jgi:alpha-2-macroglobulin
MDLLRFFALLPGRLARLTKSLFQIVANALGPILRIVFGNISFSWSRPEWIAALMAAVRRQPRHFAGGALGCLAAIGLVWGGWLWYRNLPHPPEPERITFEAPAPQITDYAPADGIHKIVIHPLEVKFSASAAPIELVGKTGSKGITMMPAIKGAWSWTDDRTLRFVPAQDWPVGAHVEVEFDPRQAFAPHVSMADDHFAFDMPTFQMTAGSGEFYQDPTNPTAKKTIMTLGFNYPVDPAELEKRIGLVLKGRDSKGTDALKFTVTYEPARIKAFVHSQPLALPRDNDAVKMTVGRGVRSVRGGDPIADPLTMETNVPGLYSLAVQSVTATLVNNDKYEPGQVAIVTTSDAVRGSDLANVVKAWILPKRNPKVHQAENDRPFAWSSDEVSDEVLRQSQPLKLEVVPTEKEFSEIQSFKYTADPYQRVYFRVPAGLKSFGGYILGKNDTRIFAVPDYPTLLRFMADGSLLSLSSDKRISVVSRNMPGMRLEIGRVLPDQLQHLVSLNSGTYSHPELDGQFSEDSIVERFLEKRAFPAGKPGEAHYEGVDLGQYLASGKRGVFLLRLSSWDPASDNKRNADNDSNTEALDSRLIVVTDLGLLAKRALDGSRDVFVQSIRTGQPVGGASVSIMALNGQTLFTQTSSSDGVVHFPTLKGLNREKRPVMYVVRLGEDLSFLPIEGMDRRLDFSRFDIGGEVNAASDGELSAYLFSDRGIYRPGDRFHVGLIVRTASWVRRPVGVPLQAEIVDPRGVSVKRQPITMDAAGFAELDYAPAETAPTGTWTVSLYIVGRNGDAETAIGSTTVSVKEFLPDSMKVDAGLSEHVADGWVKPGALKGLVDVHNLFGTPAANRRVEASLTLNPTFPDFRNWADYHFYDVRHAKDGYTTKLQDGRTDDHGHAEFDLDLKKYADATFRLDFLAKAYEAGGGRNVAASAETLVSSNDWLVGYKAVDDLAYIPRGSRHSVRLLAIDPQTRSIELNGLQAQLIERRYVSVLTKQDSGVYKYESKLKEVPVHTAPLAIAATGTDYPLPSDKPGDFAVLIRSGDSTVNRIEYSVTGAANLSRSLDRNSELQVKLNKSDFAPGEAVEVSLRAPYAGSGLITIERDKVYAHAWFSAKTTNSVQHITVPAGFEGNGYINVQYVRDPSSDEIFMSPLSYGVAPFSVNVDARRNAVKVDAPQLVKPGQTVTFKLHTARPARVVVFAVDEGILRVAHYKLEDPLKFFFRKRMLEVQTAQILDLILPDFKKLQAAAAPGGDGGDAIGRQLNPFKRKRDKPVTYWSGIVDVNSEKDFQYRVPDYFHGGLRVMAVAVSPAQIGIAENSTVVRGDFVLSPTAPTTLAPGDEADIGVGVSNNLTGIGSATVPVSVTLEAGPQFQLLGGNVQKLNLAPMHEGVVNFRVRATAALGSGNLTFTASYGGKSAAQSIDVSIRPAVAYRAQIDIARVAPKSKKAMLNLRSMYDQDSQRQASISTVPLVLSQGLSDWLAKYDNYCSEQIVSMSIPRLVASKWSTLPVVARSTPQVTSDRDPLMVQIDALRTRQNAQGGFGLWTATPEAEPFVSAYAMHFLLEARDRGAAVPRDMIGAGDSYLQQLARGEDDGSMAGLRQRAYAVYLLTRQGNVTTNSLAAVQKRLQDAYPNIWKNDLAAAWLAASYKMLKQDKEADAMIAGPQRLLEREAKNGSYGSGGEAYFYDDYMDPLIRDSSVLYLLARHFPERARTLSPRAMENISRPLESGLVNTLSAGMTLLALDAYADNNAEAVDKLGIEELHSGSSKSIATLQNKLLQMGSWSGSATGLRFSNGSALPAWSVVSQAGYDRDIPAKAIRNGLEITRDYTRADGKPLDNITLGDEIEVHVKIRATDGKGIGNIAIVDLLPGGFDPVQSFPPQADANANGQNNESDENAGPLAPTIRAPGSTWTPEYTDMREDRVVIYGSASPDVQEYIYRIKAGSSGKFIAPPAYGEAMYDRRVQARAPGGTTLTVKPVP